MRGCFQHRLETSLLVQILQQDFDSFVVADAAELRRDGAERRLHLRGHRLITAVQKAANKTEAQTLLRMRKNSCRTSNTRREEWMTSDCRWME